MQFYAFVCGSQRPPSITLLMVMATASPDKTAQPVGLTYLTLVQVTEGAQHHQCLVGSLLKNTRNTCGLGT